MKTITLLLLLLCTPYLQEEEKKEIHYTGNTHWIDDKSIEGQYLENLVYQSIEKPIYVLDSGVRYPVTSFDFVYKELGVYENDEGRPTLMVDIKSAKIDGDHIDTAWVRALQDRLAWGDTLIFTDVRYRRDSQLYIAHPLKVYMYMPAKLRD